MALADDYAAWIVANADKKGTPEFNTVAAAYQDALKGGGVRAPSTYDPTEGMSTFQKVAAGAGKAFYDVGRGVGQRLGLVSQEDIDAAKKLDAPLMNTGAGTAGNIAGNLAVYSPLALVPGANTIAGGAAVGALTGAMQPTASDESVGGNALMGAVAGGVVPAAIKAGQVAKAALVDPFTEAGKSRIVGGALNRAAADPVAASQRMATAQGKTPGFMPTAGQAAGDSGVASLERAARAIDPGGFDAVDKSQRAALANALLDIAKTPEARADAVSLRGDVAKAYYDAAMDPANQMPMTPWLKGQITQLLRRPSVNAASKDAQRWAIERGEKPSPAGSMRALHDVKQSIDDAISQATREGRGGDVAALNGTKDQLLRVMEKLSPVYADARSSYADLSRPINQMDIGRELYNRFEPALSQASTYPFSLTSGALAKAVQNGDQLAKNVTGMQGAKLSTVLTPEQLASVHGVVQDAASMAAANNAGRGVGSDTVQKLAMSHVIGETGLPSWITDFPLTRPMGGWMRTAGDILYSKNDDSLRRLLADTLRDPQAAAKAMQAANVTPSALAEALKKIPQAAAFTAIPSLENQ
jgi:hypothetical protein